MTFYARNVRNLFPLSLAILAGLMAFCPVSPASGQENDAPVAPQNVSRADVEALRTAVGENTQLDETIKSRALQLYDEALALFPGIEESQAKAAEFDRMIEEAPGRLEELREAQNTPVSDEAPQIPENASLTEMEAMLATADAAYKEAQASYENLMREPNRRAERRRAIPDLQAAVNQRLQDARAQLGEAAPAGEAAELTAARRTLAQVRIQAANAELHAYSREVSAYDSRGQLLDLRQLEARRRLAYAERQFKAIQERTTQLRRIEAERAAEEARQAMQEITKADPAIRDTAVELAATNQALADLRTGKDGIAGKIESATAQLETVSSALRTLEDEYERIIERVAAGGLNSTVGVLLRRQKGLLPDIRELRANVRERREEITEIELATSDLREQRLALADTSVALEERITSLTNISDYERDQIRRTVNDLLSNQRSLLDALQRDFESYFGVLFDLNTREAQLAESAAMFRDYINENIFWVAGTGPLDFNALQGVLPASLWLSDPDAWFDAPYIMLEDFFARLPLHIGLAVLLPILIFLRRKARLKIRDLGREARKKRSTTFSHTIEALALSIFVSVAFPAYITLLLLHLGVALESLAQADALLDGALFTAYIYFFVEALRTVFMRDGLADAHFGWPETRLRSARVLVTAVFIGLIPLTIVIFGLEAQNEESYKEGLGRICYVLALLSVAFAMQTLTSKVYHALREQQSTNWYVTNTTVRRAIRFAMTGLPLGLAIAAIAGYYYSALQLGMRFYFTLVLISAAMLLIALVRRWMILTRRELAIDQARRRREAARAESEATEENRDVSIPSESELIDEELDLVRIDVQTQKLVRMLALVGIVFGGWFIWSDVVPALNVFNRVELWTVTETVEETVSGPEGAEEIVSRTRTVPITLANFGMAVIMLMIMWAGLKNVPGLLEIFLTRKLQMASGERYATLAVIRYVIIGIGLFLAFNAMGVGWSRLQWLFAALSLGLGFGLQEIFANFVSGLILLFERPIRVGDVVTVNGTSGTVSQIRIRATTIIDWDRKELIVPNKSFVTGELVNWNLTEEKLRVVVKVGIAYGSDVRKAKELMLKVANDHPLTLKDPQPQVYFLGFGDSSLDLELRVFSPDLGNFLVILDDMHMGIDETFREHSIEIPFPQRDLHVRSGLDKLNEAIADSKAVPMPRPDGDHAS